MIAILFARCFLQHAAAPVIPPATVPSPSLGSAVSLGPNGLSVTPACSLLSLLDRPRDRRRAGNVRRTFFQENVVHHTRLAHPGIDGVPTDVIGLRINFRLSRRDRRNRNDFVITRLRQVARNVCIVRRLLLRRKTGDNEEKEKGNQRKT